MPRRNKKRKEEICEDYCFSCKDGGLLRICDYKDCLKAYHPDCVDKDETFLESEERWSCDWHSCFICSHRLSKFRCLCCPRAVCGKCFHDAEFVIIKGDKGICQICLNLAILCEIGSADDSEKVVDFKDETSYEFFFISYWEYIKKKEGLTRESLHRAEELLKKDKNYSNDLFFHQTGKIAENIEESGEESDFVVSDYDDSEEPWRKRRKSKKSSGGSKMKAKPKKREFNGWGSQSLLEFLHSLDRDTNIPMSENEVVSIVMKYCVENKLFDPQRRKRIICNEMLRALFGKKFILKHSLTKLLCAHFASNVDESSGDEIISSSDDEDNVVVKRRNTSSSHQKTQKEEEKEERKEKEKPEVLKSCYALVSTDNIKLVYLKRTLVDELLMREEEFEAKVVGSFVRVKCNLNDYLQRNSHQLLQVKGVTKSTNGNILLQLFDRPEDFPVDELSDDSFTEEECEDLCRKVKDGLLKKLTVVELEQKARSLHKDITNHRITKELAFLKMRIDHANEKGWKRELNDYLERSHLLKDPSERERLLNGIPEIIAEIVVQEPEKDGRSSSFDWCDSGSENFSHPNENKDWKNQALTSTREKPSQEAEVLSQEVRDNNGGMNRHQPALDIKGSCREKLLPKESRQKCQAPIFEGICEMNIQTQLKSSRSSTIGESSANKPLRDRQAKKTENQSTFKVEVIELSEDEAEEINIEISSKQKEHLSFKERPRTSSINTVDLTDVKNYVKKGEDSNSSLWYCRSSLGYKAGPFKMSSIRSCFETRDHQLEIKVWRIGEREEDALPLEDVIHMLFT